MDITVRPGKLSGTVAAIPSKSHAHRLLICAALGKKPCNLLCPQTNRDIEATAACLNALGAKITATENGYHIQPISQPVDNSTLFCGESGSTLRFLLPVVGALGVSATFVTEGRLSQRPLSPLWEEMERMGCKLCWQEKDRLTVTGKLQAGSYRIDGGVSSQFVSGLLFAHAILSDCGLEVTGKLESKPYVDMTEDVISLFHGGDAPDTITVEGDWSNAAFWLAAKVLGNDLTVTGLSESSSQGDRMILDILSQLKDENPTIDASDIPDLVPILSVCAASLHGATFTGVRRLRLKESDRIASIIALLTALGGNAKAAEDTLTIFPAKLSGGTVDACNDHRIAMAAAIASTVGAEPVTILGAQCVSKSYPAFWEEFSRLGGKI